MQWRLTSVNSSVEMLYFFTKITYDYEYVTHAYKYDYYISVIAFTKDKKASLPPRKMLLVSHKQTNNSQEYKKENFYDRLYSTCDHLRSARVWHTLSHSLPHTNGINQWNEVQRKLVLRSAHTYSLFIGLHLCNMRFSMFGWRFRTFESIFWGHITSLSWSCSAMRLSVFSLHVQMFLYSVLYLIITNHHACLERGKKSKA